LANVTFVTFGFTGENVPMQSLQDGLTLIMKLSIEEVQKRFPGFEIELVRDMVKVAEIKSCEKGEYIQRKGHYIRSMLIIFDGLVKVLRENSNGNHFFMHYVKSGQAFPLTMIYGDRQEASDVTAIAFEKTILIAIPLSCMDKWMKEYKSWYQYVFDTFRERVKELLKTLDNIVFLNMDERLVFYLKRNSEILQTKNIPVTRTEIAREFNSSREVITRLLNKLAEQGKIKMHRHFIEIIDL
jgi:CRP/FNR family transcriptional regulator, anaerobic regulatory protein